MTVKYCHGSARHAETVFGWGRDAIFENLRFVHGQASRDRETLRISMDSKAKVKIGEFSLRGLARGRSTVRAADHDIGPSAVLTPVGILELAKHQLNLVFGTSRDTSVFMVVALQWFWNNRQEAYPGVQRLLINLDNGP